MWISRPAGMCGVPLGDVDRVQVMVEVPVREQDHVRLELVGLRRRLRVLAQERVDEQRRPAGPQLEARVSEPPDVHSHQSSPFVSTCASSYPTATPTSMLTRVSSATSAWIA